MSTTPACPLELTGLIAGAPVTHRLPQLGLVTIGRAEDADVRLKDPSVSRRHAILHVGPPLRIEDLGSANGVRVLTHRAATDTTEIIETRVPRCGSLAISPGDGIALGAALLILRLAQQGDDAPATSRVIRSFTEPVIEHPTMRAIHATAARVAHSTINVLILGETGVGKEVLAEEIHRSSPRAHGPLICINCAALTESLLESELFGHELGAFTGALKAKAGLLETAQGGTIFLDEVGEIPPALQVKLLRVLEERKVLRVGGLTKRPINVRFIAATNRDLEAESQRGAFRQDLFFRLNGISLVIPPLRERVSEIRPLAQTFLARAAMQAHGRAPILSPEAIDALERYRWPGNVRELRNVVERAILLCCGDPIMPEHLGINHPTRSLVTPRERSSTIPPPQSLPLRVKKGEDERKRIREALDQCAGNQRRAAELLGISRRTLVSRLSEYGIDRPRKKD